jgi:hypothetical protein
MGWSSPENGGRSRKALGTELPVIGVDRTRTDSLLLPMAAVPEHVASRDVRTAIMVYRFAAAGRSLRPLPINDGGWHCAG